MQGRVVNHVYLFGWVLVGRVAKCARHIHCGGPFNEYSAGEMHHCCCLFTYTNLHMFLFQYKERILSY